MVPPDALLQYVRDNVGSGKEAPHHGCHSPHQTRIGGAVQMRRASIPLSPECGVIGSAGIAKVGATDGVGDATVPAHTDAVAEYEGDVKKGGS